MYHDAVNNIFTISGQWIVMIGVVLGLMLHVVAALYLLYSTLECVGLKYWSLNILSVILIACFWLVVPYGTYYVYTSNKTYLTEKVEDCKLAGTKVEFIDNNRTTWNEDKVTQCMKVLDVHIERQYKRLPHRWFK